jgi:mRNA interferase RelE/StbE
VPVYEVRFTRKAAKQFDDLPADVQTRLAPRIDALAANPRPHGAIKLRGEEAYRIRVGDYRIAYEIRDDDLVVFVIKVGGRGGFYG